MSYYISGTNINSLIEEFGTNSASSAFRVMTALDAGFLQGGSQLHGASYNSRFHFPALTAAFINSTFLTAGTNWLNGQVCRQGYAPMSRSLLTWAMNGTFRLQYRANDRRARWVHESGGSTGNSNGADFACPPCVIVIACASGGNGGTAGQMANNGAGGGGAGNVSAALINFLGITSGSSWIDCFRFIVGGVGADILCDRLNAGTIRAFTSLRGGNGGNGGANNPSAGLGGGGSGSSAANIIQPAGHTSAAAATTGWGRPGVIGGGGSSGVSRDGQNFINNIYTSFGTGNMGLVNQSQVAGSYGAGGLRQRGEGGTSGGQGSGGAGGFYGNGGNGGRSSSGPTAGLNASGFGAGGGGGSAGNLGQGTSTAGLGSSGIVAIYR